MKFPYQPFQFKASSIVSILFAMKNRLHEKSSLSLTPLCLVIFMTLYFDLFLIISFFFFLLHHRRRTVKKLETEQNFFSSWKRKLRLISDELEREALQLISHKHFFRSHERQQVFFYVFGHLFLMLYSSDDF